MTNEERRLRRQQREHAKALMREAKEAGKGPIDTPFLVLTLLLTGVGLVMLFSASFPSAYYETGNPAHYFTRQLIFAVLGVVAMLFAGKFNYARLRGFVGFLMGLSLILLLLVAIPGIGQLRNGSRRWLGSESFSFQPSELAKFAIILYFADSISKKKDKMRDWRTGILPYAVILGAFSVLLMFEPHLSCTILIWGIGVVMMFVGGMSYRWLGVGALGLGGVAGLYLSGAIGYNASRIKIWRDPLNPEWKLDDGYQIRQSLLAIGSGGLFGVGLGKSRQKYLFLPEEHNDFIFSVICEELGLIGAILVMLIFALLIIRGYWIALHARDRFGSLLAIGITTQIALQVFLNIAVVTNLLPATGVSLPFFSYGGTALFFQLAEAGVILSVSRQMPPT